MAITTSKIKRKKGQEKITVLTCYDYQMAQILDKAEIDILLVGDSLGNVVLGFDDTTMVEIDHIIHHVEAVKRGAKNSMIVADMPFLTFNLSAKDTLKNAGLLIKAGAAAVKVEGGRHIVKNVRALTEAGIPVMGHLGLTPQSVNQLGGYIIQGKTVGAAKKMIDDAKLLQDAGCFSIVLECIPEDLGRLITEAVEIPTIGIGAGRYCDGQVLVINDLLGMGFKKPATFVKQYANIGEIIENAARQYAVEVKAVQYPEESHIFQSGEKLY